MYTKKEREYYNQHRANVCERLGITKNQYNYIRRIGEQLHKVYENDCNGLYKDENESRIAESKITSKLYRYMLKYFSLPNTIIYTYFQTDPRGATIYLDKSPITQANYTNTSCIY